MFVLQAATKGLGIRYFMNFIMITSQIECAKKYKSTQEAQNDIKSFEMLFTYETPKVEVVELVD